MSINASWFSMPIRKQAGTFNLSGLLTRSLCDFRRTAPSNLDEEKAGRFYSWRVNLFQLLCGDLGQAKFLGSAAPYLPHRGQPRVKSPWDRHPEPLERLGQRVSTLKDHALAGRRQEWR